MTTALALAQLIVPLLPSIAGDISELISWICGVRKAAQQSGEWTAAMEQEFRDTLIETGHDPAYQLDDKS